MQTFNFTMKVTFVIVTNYKSNYNHNRMISIKTKSYWLMLKNYMHYNKCFNQVYSCNLKSQLTALK